MPARKLYALLSIFALLQEAAPLAAAPARSAKPAAVQPPAKVATKSVAAKTAGAKTAPSRQAAAAKPGKAKAAAARGAAAARPAAMPPPVQFAQAVAAPTAEPALTGRGEQTHDLAEERLIVSVAINGQRVADAMLALRRADGFYLPRPALAEMRLVTGGAAATAPGPGAEYVALGSLPGITVDFDAGEQELRLTAEAQAFDRQVLDLSRRQADRVTQPSASGGFLNYDVVAQGGADPGYAAGFVEAGAPVGGGTFETTAISRSFGAGSGLVRLETAYRRDFPEDLLRLKLGDAIARGGDWGRPFRFGGVQIATDFSVQPGFVPFPTATFAGQAALPSTIDVFVNDALRYRGTVDQGPFLLNQIPAITGGGEARVVLTDPLGRQEAVSLPFQISPLMLKEGIADFSYEAGFLRSGFTQRSDAYEDFILAGTHRYGLSDALTVEGHGEATFQAQALGGSAIAAISGLGEVSGEIAYAHGHAVGGWLAGLGFTRSMQRWQVGLHQRWMSPDFERARPVESSFGFAKRSETVANASLSLGRWGSLAATLARQSFDDLSSATIASTAWSYPLTERVFLNAYALESRQDDSILTVGLTVTFFFGGTDTGSVDRHSRGGVAGGSAQLRHSPAADGWGYGARMVDDQTRRFGADVSRRTRVGDFELAIDRYGTRHNARATASGGLALVEDKVFLSRRIDNAFGLVSVPGFAGLTVLQENQAVGVTDEEGDLFLPRLLPNYSNKIALDPADLPIDAEIGEIEQAVIPGHRSIAVMRFDARREGGRLLTVTRAGGAPMAPGLVARRLRDGAIFPTGFDGAAFVAGNDGDAFEIEDESGTCRFRLPAVTGAAPKPEAANLPQTASRPPQAVTCAAAP